MSSYINKIIKLTNTKTETKHIILCGDKNYIKYCGITMTSVLHSNSAEKFTFELFCDDISDADLEKLKKTQRKYNTNINIYIINKDEVNSLIDSVNKETHISVATFFRILAFESLDRCIEKALYLDSDLLVRGNINSLYEYKFKANELIIAIEDIDGKNCGDNINVEKYFNAGVMFVNLAKWIKESYTDKCIRDIIKKHYTMMDQDALNVLLVDKVKYIEEKYNFQYSMDYKNRKNEYNDLIISKKNPAIVHFIGKIKPWDELGRYFPISNEYLKIKDESEWKDISLTNISSIKTQILRRGYAKSMMRAALHNKRYIEYLKGLFYYIKNR